jgi:hypothetical protein
MHRRAVEERSFLPKMQPRVVAAAEEQLAVVLKVAEQASMQRAQIGHRAERKHDRRK